MLRLAWLPIAQHVFQPALTGRLELISWKIVSSEQEQRLSRWADFAKNCLPWIECKELQRFREKYRALGRHVCKIHEIGGQKKWGPTCDRDISNCTIYTTTIYRAYTVYKHAKRMETTKQSSLWSSLGTHDSVVFIWWLCISNSGETRKFDCSNQSWPWRSRSIATQNNRDLNQAIFHLWSKFGDPSLNG